MEKKKGPENASTQVKAKARSLANLLLSEADGDALRALGLLCLLRKDSQISITVHREGKETPSHEQT